MPAEGTPKPSPSVSELQLRVEELANQLRSKTEECEEGLQREAAVAEILRAIGDPSADLARVFDVMIEKAAKLCAAYGYVWLYDGEQARAIAAFVEQPFRDWLRNRDPFVPAEAGALGQAILHKRPVHVVDAAEHETYRSFRNFREVIDKGGVRTLLYVPLCRGDDVLGVMTVFRQERRPFSDRQIALLESFAAQAVIALENARLFDDLRERTGELARSVNEITATSDVLKIISRSPVDLITVLDTLVETASRLCGADHATMFRWRDGLFHMVASHGLTGEGRQFYLTHPIALDRGTLVGRTALERKPVHVVDVLKDPDYTYWEGQKLIGFRTMLGIPILRDEQLIGVFAINRTRAEAFIAKDIELVRTFADQAVIAIENARLFEELHDRQAELRVTIDNMGGGVAMFDADLRLTAWNRNIQQILDLSDEDLAARPTYEEYLRMLADRGEYGSENVGETLSGFLEDPGQELRLERVRPDGTVVEVRRNAVPGGGFVVIYIDITARKKAEAEIAAARDAAEAALERQTATADILKVIASSPTDVQPVLDAVARAAQRFCGAADAVISLCEADEFIRAAHEGSMPSVLGRSALDRNSISGRSILDGRTIHIPDIGRLDPEDLPTSQALAATSGARAALAAPMLREGSAVGCIMLRKPNAGSFAPTQIELLETFAAQAVIAIENVRLFTELREALDRQTATAEVLRVINASPGDLTPVFDAILEKAHALCGAAYGTLQLYDGERFYAVATHGLSEPWASRLREGYLPGSSNSPPGRLLAGEDHVHIRDLAERDEPIARAAVEQGGFRTLLAVALRKESKFLGQIVAARKEVRPFADKEISLLRSFAAQAVIAMENARLLNEQREALARQTATAEVLEVINASPGKLAPVFDAMLEKAMSLCEASFGSLWTLEHDRFRPVAHHGLPAPYADYLRRDVPAAGTGTGRARLLAGEAFAHIADLADEEPYRTGEPHRRALVDLGGARTGLLVPLRRDDAVCGFIMIYRQEVRPFMDKQIALLQTFAAQAVIAMENARLLGELRERTDQVAALNRGLEARVAEQVEELGRVGRLKRFLAPQLAELIVSQGDEKILESHRREIVVVFCDVRGYTGFAETAEPEEVLDFLREYHGALGPLVSQFEGTLDQFSGDGIMVFFNDPVPIPDPAERAVRMAVAMREAASTLIAAWRERGRELGFGVGIAQGYATLGQIGFSERSGYTAIGTVCNVAARLCAEAKDGQVLLSQRVNVALKGSIATEQLGTLPLKGLTQPVVAYNVPSTASQPTLRVIDGGNQVK